MRSTFGSPALLAGWPGTSDYYFNMLRAAVL